MAYDLFKDRLDAAISGSRLGSDGGSELSEGDHALPPLLYARGGPLPARAARPPPTSFRTLWAGSPAFRYGVVFLALFVFATILFAVLRPRFVLSAAHVEIGDDIEIPRQDGSRYIKPVLRMSAGKLFGFAFLVATLGVLAGVTWQLLAQRHAPAPAAPEGPLDLPALPVLP